MSLRNVTCRLPWLISAILFVSTIGFAQGQPRKIDKMSWRTEPLKILKTKTKGRQIEIGKNFDEGDDWLKGLVVTVQNISDKAIARIVLDLTFPRLEGPSTEIPTYTIRMMFGLEPTDDGAETLKLVQPNETVDVKLLEVNLPFIAEDLKQLGYPEQINRARISIGSVTFSDGTMWVGETILYPDLNDPKRKINPRHLIGFVHARTRQRANY